MDPFVWLPIRRWRVACGRLGTLGGTYPNFFVLVFMVAKIIISRACLLIHRFLLTLFSSTSSQWRACIGIHLFLAGILHPGSGIQQKPSSFSILVVHCYCAPQSSTVVGKHKKKARRCCLVWNIIHAYNKLSLIKYQQWGAQLVIASRENQVK